MKGGEARQTEVAGGGLAAAQDGAPTPLGWDGIGAIGILLLAAVSLRGWVSEPSVAHVLLRVLWWIVQLAALTRLLQQYGTRWLTGILRNQPALCLLLTLALASCLWSLAPPNTLHKAASLLGTTMLGVFIACTCSPQRVMRVMHWTFTILIVCSTVVAVTLPPRVVEGMKTGWTGIMSDPNNFGAAAVFAAMFVLVATWARRVHLLWGTALCSLSLLAVMQSRSRTAAVALGISLIACAYLLNAGGTRRAARVMLRWPAVGLVLGLAIVPLLVAPLATNLGIGDPFNRAHVWGGALTILRERPLTGYGYAAVWGRTDATLLPHITATANRSANNAHNSIVDVATELGIPAAIVACVYLFGALSNAGRLLEREYAVAKIQPNSIPNPFSVFALVFTLGFTVMGFAEAHLLRIHSFFWILFVALTVMVKRSLNTCTARIGTER